MKRASYRFGVQWIADNDETLELDPDMIAAFISVALLADLFKVETERVARDVLRLREKGSSVKSPFKDRVVTCRPSAALAELIASGCDGGGGEFDAHIPERAGAWLTATDNTVAIPYMQDGLAVWELL